jgi:hypothetical protein
MEADSLRLSCCSTPAPIALLAQATQPIHDPAPIAPVAKASRVGCTYVAQSDHEAACSLSRQKAATSEALRPRGLGIDSV